MKRTRKRITEQGSVVIFATMFIVVVMGFAALTIDIGMLCTAQSELQNAADAAVAAGVSRLMAGDYTGALDQAWVFGGLNTCMGQAVQLTGNDVELGTYDFTQGTFTPAPGGVFTGSNAIRVTARRTQGSAQGPLTLFFAPIIGHTGVDVESSAVASVDTRVTGFDGSVSGILLPFVVSESMVGSSPTVGFTFNMYPNRDEWNVDGGSATAITAIDFEAYGGAVTHGGKVAAVR